MAEQADIKVSILNNILMVEGQGYEGTARTVVNLDEAELVTYMAYESHTRVTIALNGEHTYFDVNTPDQADAIISQWLEIHAR